MAWEERDAAAAEGLRLWEALPAVAVALSCKLVVGDMEGVGESEAEAEAEAGRGEEVSCPDGEDRALSLSREDGERAAVAETLALLLPLGEALTDAVSVPETDELGVDESVALRRAVALAQADADAASAEAVAAAEGECGPVSVAAPLSERVASATKEGEGVDEGDEGGLGEAEADPAGGEAVDEPVTGTPLALPSAGVADNRSEALPWAVSVPNSPPDAVLQAVSLGGAEALAQAPLCVAAPLLVAANDGEAREVAVTAAGVAV